MKILCGLTAVAMLALAGCEQGNPGGPGATTDRTANKPVTGQASERTFTLDVPNLETKIKQGETKQVAIGIARGKNFAEDVTVKFMDAPKGVTLEPANPVIKHGDKDVKVKVKAADDAAVGTFGIKVAGTPTQGANASNEFKITIVKK